MNTQEIMQKVRRIEMRARKLATTTFAGQYRSGFRGQGLDFDDFREYQPGDEPRFIEWKVTARTGVPYVRRFHEEREQVLLLCVDVSASMNYAGAGQPDSKREFAALIAAVLAYSAARNGDKVGLLLFGCQPNRFLRPDKGIRQCLRIINTILTAPVDGQDDSAEAVSDAVLSSQRKPAMVFLVSDFLMPPDKQSMGRLSFRHELIPVRVNDEAELHRPPAGRVYLQQPETGALLCGDLKLSGLRRAHAAAVQAHMEDWDRVFMQLGVDSLTLKTGVDFMPALRGLFARRSRHFVH